MDLAGHSPALKLSLAPQRLHWAGRPSVRLLCGDATLGTVSGVEGKQVVTGYPKFRHNSEEAVCP